MEEKISKCTFTGAEGEYQVKVKYTERDYSITFFSKDNNLGIVIRNRAKLLELIQDRGKIMVSKILDKELIFLRDELDKRLSIGDKSKTFTNILDEHFEKTEEVFDKKWCGKRCRVICKDATDDKHTVIKYEDSANGFPLNRFDKPTQDLIKSNDRWLKEDAPLYLSIPTADIEVQINIKTTTEEVYNKEYLGYSCRVLSTIKIGDFKGQSLIKFKTNIGCKALELFGGDFFGQIESMDNYLTEQPVYCVVNTNMIK